MKDHEIVEALGGPPAIFAATGISLDAARKFITRGIPWKHRPKIAALAKRKKVSLPPDFLENQRKA